MSTKIKLSNLSTEVTSYISSAAGAYLDSAEAIALIDSNYVQARQTNSSNTDLVTEGSTNLYYTTARFDSDFGDNTTSDLTEGTNLYYTDARARAAISGTGSLSYNSSTGVMSFTQGSTDTVSEGSTNLYYTTTRFDSDFGDNTTSDLSEGTNLYYTTARADSDAKAAISVTDAGGDGSLTYSSGVITYTGPSASETRAHFSAGTGVTLSSGEIAIGQAVATTDSVTFSGLTVSGDLTVTGTTTQIDTIAYTVTDPLLHLADSNETSDTVDIGFVGHYSDDGGSTKKHTGLFRDASDDKFKIFYGLQDAALDSSVPTNVIDTAGTGYTVATLVGNLEGDVTGDINADSADITTLTTSTVNASSSINVDGYVTADGLTLGNANYIRTSDNASTTLRMFGMNSSNATYIGPIDPYAGGNIFWGASSNVNDQIFLTGGNNRLKIFNNGDISFREDTGTTDKFFWDASTERLGIGTTSPAQKLTVYDGMLLLEQSAASNNLIRFTENSSESFHLGVDASANFHITGPSFTNDKYLTVDTSGNVGIGTTSPNAKLDVRGRTDIYAGGTGWTDHVNLWSSDATNKWNILVDNGASDMFRIGYNGASKVNITTGGDLLVGTTTNTRNARLLVDGGETAQFQGYGDAIGAGLYMRPSASASGGNAIPIQFTNTSASVVGQISTTSSGTTYSTTSDRRLKDNIELITDGKEKLLSMKPCTFTFKADEDKKLTHGFIAQEMKPIMPEAVSGEDDSEDMMSMDYGRITPVIVAALQDALKEIEELKKRINTLENK